MMHTVTPDVLDAYHNLWQVAPEDEPWEATQARADALFEEMIRCPDWQVSGLPPDYSISLQQLIWCTAKWWQRDTGMAWQAFADSIRASVTVVETLHRLGANDATLWRWMEVTQDPERLGLVQALVEVFDRGWMQN